MREAGDRIVTADCCGKDGTRRKTAAGRKGFTPETVEDLLRGLARLLLLKSGGLTVIANLGKKHHGLGTEEVLYAVLYAVLKGAVTAGH